MSSVESPYVFDEETDPSEEIAAYPEAVEDVPAPPSEPFTQTAFPLPDAATQRRIQIALKGLKRYRGSLNGDFGRASWRAIQETVGYEGSFPGLPDTQTVELVSEYARELGSYDGTPDTDVWVEFASALESELK